tara:strand:+ start:192 stop:959 length:768 start_codon:yes stop_codon:yes gene_type:complete
MAWNFKDRIEDLSGIIPTTADGLQFVENAVVDVIDKTKQFQPADLPLFAQEITVSDSGTAIENATILDVKVGAKNCRSVGAAQRLAVSDSTSIDYATTTDPAYYILHGKLFVYPTGGVNRANVVRPGAVSSWNSDTSSIANFPDDKYRLVVINASMQNILHKIGILELNTMIDSDWGDTLDYDFDGENIDFNTWYQTLGDMIQKQEDVELAQAQMNKISTFTQSDQQQLQKHIALYNTLKMEYESAFGMRNATPQ